MEASPAPRGRAGVWIGLAIMVVSEAATLGRIEPFRSWNTPIAWTGFILFADSIVWRARGRSWLRSAPGEFVWLAVASIGLWLVFEGYNLLVRNWYYTGLPANPALRLVGYAWSFATIWPAIFEAAALIGVLRGTTAPGTGGRSAAPSIFRPGEIASIALGAAMLGTPLVAPPELRPYLAAPVWLGFIFLLDPVNRHLGGPSLAADLEQGTTGRTIDLALGGVMCGFLWEFWNFWAAAKWHYTVPIMERVKLFEMPLPGYLGFPAFALECFTMFVFVRCVCARWMDPARGQCRIDGCPSPVTR
ncbi:MAG: hypothetical protein IT176_00985 [Acidobacteria bacterium]|nr:hypothetical protein [Acidobacteriota bacterium]